MQVDRSQDDALLPEIKARSKKIKCNIGCNCGANAPRQINDSSRAIPANNSKAVSVEQCHCQPNGCIYAMKNRDCRGFLVFANIVYLTSGLWINNFLNHLVGHWLLKEQFTWWIDQIINYESWCPLGSSHWSLLMDLMVIKSLDHTYPGAESRQLFCSASLIRIKIETN